MTCPYCKEELPEGTRFCTNCGKYIQESVSQEEAVPEENGPEASPFTFSWENTSEDVLQESIPEEPENSLVPEEPSPETDSSVPSAAPSDEIPAAAAAADTPGAVFVKEDPNKPVKDSPWASISTIGWIGIKLLLTIPIVNMILVLVWSFGGCQKNVKKTYSRATLILVLANCIICVVCLILILTHIPAVVSLLGKLALLAGRITMH